MSPQVFEEPNYLTGLDIRRWREERGVTAYRLAKELGVAQSTISRWERQEMEIQSPRMVELTLQRLTSKYPAKPVPIGGETPK